MPKTRQSLRLLPHESEVLRSLYREFNIPTDQYPHRPQDLLRLVSTWNELTGRHEAASDVLHYMVTRRKKGQWERLGWNAGSDFVPPTVEFSDDELGHLDAIHEELQIASDNYALNPEFAGRLQKEFARRAGRIVPAMILAAAMIGRRKAGSLATLKPQSDGQDMAFQDIEKVANG